MKYAVGMVEARGIEDEGNGGQESLPVVFITVSGVFVFEPRFFRLGGGEAIFGQYFFQAYFKGLTICIVNQQKKQKQPQCFFHTVRL